MIRYSKVAANNKPQLVFAFNGLCALVGEGVLPVLVFDGPRDKAKKGGTESSTRRFSPDEEETMITLCLEMGLPFFKAPSEAEAMLAALERSEKIHGIISEDSDLICLGANSIIRDFHVTSGVALGSLVDGKTVRASLGLSVNQLIDVAILAGCDFTPGVRGVGIQKAMQHVREGRSAEGFPKSYMTLADMDALREHYRLPDVSRITKLLCTTPDSKPLLRTLIAELRQDFKIRDQLSDYTQAFNTLEVASHAKLVWRKEYESFVFPKRTFNVVYNLPGREKLDGRLIVDQKTRSHKLLDEKDQDVSTWPGERLELNGYAVGDEIQVGKYIVYLSEEVVSLSG